VFVNFQKGVTESYWFTASSS